MDSSRGDPLLGRVYRLIVSWGTGKKREPGRQVPSSTMGTVEGPRPAITPAEVALHEHFNSKLTD